MNAVNQGADFSGATVGPEELAARIGLQPNQREAMHRYLNRYGVRYFEGRKGPWTTVAALNDALGVSSEPQLDPIIFD